MKKNWKKIIIIIQIIRNKRRVLVVGDHFFYELFGVSQRDKFLLLPLFGASADLIINFLRGNFTS